MGVTYKAVDVNLHRSVALKIISEKYLRDDAVRLRFLREARAAASIRHPNVASVFHLGKTESGYFRGWARSASGDIEQASHGSTKGSKLRSHSARG
jgi:serine/threonine protein kinase